MAKRKSVLFISAAILILLLLLGRISSAPERQQLIFVQDSLYQHIRVYQEGNLRALRFGASSRALNQSQIDVTDLNRHVLEYSRLAFSGLLVNENPKRVLIIGLGGGVIPREMRRCFPEAEIDVVEIDPIVAEVAQKFFFFRPDQKMRVHISDGRVFVRQKLASSAGTKYDMIILDAFNSEYIPYHLTTREFLQQVAALLDPKGVVVANVFSSNQLFDAELKTFLAVFGRCYAFFGWLATNVMLVTPGKEAPDLNGDDILARAARLQERHKFSFDFRSVAQQFRPRLRPREDAKILTDDHAPADLLRHKPR